MINRVELVLAINFIRCGNSIVIIAFWLEKNLQSSHEIINVRHMRQTLFPNEQVCTFLFLGQIPSGFDPRNLTTVGIPFSLRLQPHLQPALSNTGTRAGQNTARDIHRYWLSPNMVTRPNGEAL